ncbi:hypothetical protein BDW72DRAFT_118543 [Aspergillus terricola var. indicus]
MQCSRAKNILRVEGRFKRDILEARIAHLNMIIILLPIAPYRLATDETAPHGSCLILQLATKTLTGCSNKQTHAQSDVDTRFYDLAQVLRSPNRLKPICLSKLVRCNAQLMRIAAPSQPNHSAVFSDPAVHCINKKADAILQTVGCWSPITISSYFGESDSILNR